MRDFGCLIKRLGMLRKYIFLLILRSPFDALRTWMLAGLMKTVFLRIETGRTGRLWFLCIGYGLICALLFFYNGTVWSIYAAFAAKVEVKLQSILVQKLLQKSLREVDSRSSGEWMTRLNNDIQAVITMMNAPGNLPHMVVAVINTLLSTILMLGSSSILFMITWVFILPHLLINYRLVLRHMPKLKTASQEAMAESTAAISPLITEADIILVYDVGELMLKKCEESSRKLMKINMKLHIRSTLSNAVMRLFGSGGYLALLVAGYWMISDETMNFSDVVYCSQVRGSILTGVFMGINCWNNIKANMVCVKRVNEL